MHTLVEPRVGYRVCVVNIGPRGEMQAESLYGAEKQGELQVGQLLHPGNRVHVGTTRRFCLAYYAGVVDTHATRREALLTLEVRQLEAVEHVERWELPCGTEAVTVNPVIRDIELLPLEE